MPARMLSLEGGWIEGSPHRLEKRTSASEDAGLKGVDTRQCASKDAEPRRRVDWGVPYRSEKGTSVGPRRVWKPLPNRRVLKT